MEEICKAYKAVWVRSPFGNISVVVSWSAKAIDEFLAGKVCTAPTCLC